MKEHNKTGLLNGPLPLINEPEGQYVPDSLPFIVDAHVHLFPNYLFAPVRQWFKKYGWPIRYQLSSAKVVNFLLSRGIGHIVALHYAHKPGLARELNDYMVNICRSHPQVTGMATVYPGEKDCVAILEQAFQNGLSGVKLHSHVQCFDMDSQPMHEIYQVCSKHHKPLIMHVGREPKSPAYRCDPYELCNADEMERILSDYPQLCVCVPHLGADEFEAYQAMLEKYDNLWLDTTMTLAEYLPLDYFPKLAEMRSDRIIYGTDFPNLPYAWDREIKRLVGLNLNEDRLERILGRNAMEFYQIDCGNS
ncbi:MAG: amidohydrolase [Deltaproteobacteria bacterium]|jgi:predicted TIM-barrel fold metal-dependent hydrolase|nr:amidohydrolase [Deltaproteobacteria bacterium]